MILNTLQVCVVVIFLGELAGCKAGGLTTIMMCCQTDINDSQYATGICRSNFLGEAAGCNTGGITTFDICCKSSFNYTNWTCCKSK